MAGTRLRRTSFERAGRMTKTLDSVEIAMEILRVELRAGLPARGGRTAQRSRPGAKPPEGRKRVLARSP
jgi:hypothetical protein